MNNVVLKAMRISKEMDDILAEASEKLGLKKCDLARFLLNKAIKKLKEDSYKAGGYDKLEITLIKI